ncbi:hypothetical protein TOK_5637 [Pseudonocardia sp. N23]|nr:hypothetical protein TOK_5637 [Pseudonocardia sp. N23]
MLVVAVSASAAERLGVLQHDQGAAQARVPQLMSVLDTESGG